ncbi:unnamed protein product [Ilex paraguariensis]|uniref:RING-type E3 ubiquitin transferase n=1 Tax=Ilex paraguariensis TaxID=185542 RepID=A0ABC8RR60_9AQUA
MGFPQTPSHPHLYSQALQQKLYQRRTSTASSPPPTLPRTLNQATPFAPLGEMGLKGNLKEKLPVISFNDDLKIKESQCCVCLGEFEINEKVLQPRLCKHIVHIDCIRHWLHSNSTCPLCRSSVIATTKHANFDLPVSPEPVEQDNQNFHHDPQNIAFVGQQGQLSRGRTILNSCSIEQHIVLIEGSSSASSSICRDSELSSLYPESVVLSIQSHGS